MNILRKIFGAAQGALLEQRYRREYDTQAQLYQALIQQLMQRHEKDLEVIAQLSAEHAHAHAVEDTHAERNHLVILVAHMAILLGWKAGIGVHEGPPLPKWPAIVRIDLPTGQCSWHIHETQLHFLAGLPAYEGRWDGTPRATKYAHIRAAYAVLTGRRPRV